MVRTLALLTMAGAMCLSACKPDAASSWGDTVKMEERKMGLHCHPAPDFVDPMGDVWHGENCTLIDSPQEDAGESI